MFLCHIGAYSVASKLPAFSGGQQQAASGVSSSSANFVPMPAHAVQFSESREVYYPVSSSTASITLTNEITVGARLKATTASSIGIYGGLAIYMWDIPLPAVIPLTLLR